MGIPGCIGLAAIEDKLLPDSHQLRKAEQVGLHTQHLHCWLLPGRRLVGRHPLQHGKDNHIVTTSRLIKTPTDRTHSLRQSNAAATMNRRARLLVAVAARPTVLPPGLLVEGRWVEAQPRCEQRKEGGAGVACTRSTAPCVEEHTARQSWKRAAGSAHGQVVPLLQPMSTKVRSKAGSEISASGSKQQIEREARRGPLLIECPPPPTFKLGQPLAIVAVAPALWGQSHHLFRQLRGVILLAMPAA